MSAPCVFLSAASDDLRSWRDVLHTAFSRGPDGLHPRPDPGSAHRRRAAAPARAHRQERLRHPPRGDRLRLGARPAAVRRPPRLPVLLHPVRVLLRPAEGQAGHRLRLRRGLPVPALHREGARRRRPGAAPPAAGRPPRPRRQGPLRRNPAGGSPRTAAQRGRRRRQQAPPGRRGGRRDHPRLLRGGPGEGAGGAASPGGQATRRDPRLHRQRAGRRRGRTGAAPARGARLRVQGRPLPHHQVRPRRAHRPRRRLAQPGRRMGEGPERRHPPAPTSSPS